MAKDRTDTTGVAVELHRRSAAERIHETVRYLLREWDDYVKQMKNMGIDRYVELHHAAHSRFPNEVGDYANSLGHFRHRGWTGRLVAQSAARPIH